MVRRRRTTSREPAKTRHGKTTKPKRSNRATVALERGPSAASRVTEIARLTRERDEALEREAAISEILHLVSKSPSDL